MTNTVSHCPRKDLCQPSTLLAVLLLVGAFAAAGAASPPALTESSLSHKFVKGVLYGKVVDLNGKPVANATVALQQPNGKVLDWAKTNEKGEYQLAADPRLALNLKPSRSKGLLEQCVDAVSDVVMVPVKLAATTVVDPGPAVKSAAVSVASGTPAPLVVQAAQSSLPNSSTPGQTSQAAGGAATNAALSGGPKATLPAAPERGQATILVTVPGYKDAKITDAAYWLDPPNDDKQNPIGVQAWLETIQMAPTAGDKKCAVVLAAVTLSNPDVQPILIPAGGDLNLKVQLESPMPDPDHKVRVFARLAAKDTVIELIPIPAQKGFYAAKMHIDPKTPAGQTTVSIGALRAVPVEVKLNPKKPDPLAEFTRRLDDMNAAKPYGYDPFVMASVNRIDVKVTILAAKPN